MPASEWPFQIQIHFVPVLYKCRSALSLDPLQVFLLQPAAAGLCHPKRTASPQHLQPAGAAAGVCAVGKLLGDVLQGPPTPLPKRFLRAGRLVDCAVEMLEPWLRVVEPGLRAWSHCAPVPVRQTSANEMLNREHHHETYLRSRAAPQSSNWRHPWGGSKPSQSPACNGRLMFTSKLFLLHLYRILQPARGTNVLRKPPQWPGNNMLVQVAIAAGWAHRSLCRHLPPSVPSCSGSVWAPAVEGTVLRLQVTAKTLRCRL